MAFTIRPKFDLIKPDLDPTIVKSAPAPKSEADYVCEKFVEASLEEQKPHKMVLDAFAQAKVTVPNACQKCKEFPECAVKVAHTMLVHKLRKAK